MIFTFNNNFYKNKNECFDIKVCSGSNSQCNNGEFEIRSHSFDYDIYLQGKNKKIKTTQHTQINIKKRGIKWDNTSNYNTKRNEGFMLTTTTQKQQNKQNNVSV